MKHDYTAALSAIQAWNEGPYTASDVFMECHLDTIIHALRFAEKMMQEPSHAVLHVVNKALNLHPEDNPSTMFAFKSMRDQALKELGE